METGIDPAWLDREPVQVYKHDARSRVWRIDAPDGQSFVIKRFEHSPLRQRIAAGVRLHPGQRESRMADRLESAGIPVVPIIATGEQPVGVGIHLWLATPQMGISLHNLFNQGHLTDPERRSRVLDAAGRLTGQLIARHWFNRDHKASNIVIDGQDQARLIDVGAVRRGRGRAGAGRMLTNLSQTLTQAGATPSDIARLLKAVSDDPGTG